MQDERGQQPHDALGGDADHQARFGGAAEVGALLKTGLERELAGVAGVVEVRGQGLILGIELDRPCAPLLGRSAEAGLMISVTAERVVRLLPALILSVEEARQIVAILCPLIKEFLAAPAPKAA